ncbi:MAG: zinc metallopeptidase [Polyangiaceae bacterium]|nr:zinc metallopeptidase [Polyangiaceae bacterium]
MRWTPGGRSADLIDMRGSSGRRQGGGGLPIGKLGIGGTIIIGLLSLVLGRNLLSGDGSQQVASPVDDASEERQVQFVSFVLDDAQKTWSEQLEKQTGTPYRRAKLVLFRDGVASACGFAESAVGPFYCPPDEKVFVDLSFFRDLKDRLGAPGDFAQAYVIAHELGHHVQNVLGTDDKMRSLQRGKSKREQNELSVRLELQADCLAGVWAHSTGQRDLLEKGDIEEAMDAAAAVGDDRLQKMGTGHVQPETWTHGSSAMRMKWFNRGLETGQVSACDTFREDEI